MRVIGLVELLVAMVAVAGTVHLSPRVAVVPKKQVAKATSPSSPGPSSGSLSTMVSSSSSSSRLGRKRSARAAPVLQEEGQDPEDRAPRAGFRVVTDIDDTVKSSGGKNIFGIYLGGVDTQFKRGTFYPGGAQFTWELSRCNRVFKDAVVPRVAVLTARAREFKFALALRPSTKIVKLFRAKGAAMGPVGAHWGIGDVLYGSVVEWVLQGRKGLRKFDNFELLLAKDERLNRVHGSSLGPKQRYIFVGDTGERDEEAGVRMIRKYPDRMRALFLHLVADTDDHSKIVLPPDRILKGVPIFYYRTFVGAATKAYSAGLMDERGLKRVVKEARVDLRAIDSPAAGRRTGTSSAWLDLERDVRASRCATVPGLQAFVNPFVNPFVNRTLKVQ